MFVYGSLNSWLGYRRHKYRRLRAHERGTLNLSLYSLHSALRLKSFPYFIQFPYKIFEQTCMNKTCVCVCERALLFCVCRVYKKSRPTCICTHFQLELLRDWLGRYYWLDTPSHLHWMARKRRQWGALGGGVGRGEVGLHSKWMNGVCTHTFNGLGCFEWFRNPIQLAAISNYPRFTWNCHRKKNDYIFLISFWLALKICSFLQLPPKKNARKTTTRQHDCVRKRNNKFKSWLGSPKFTRTRTSRPWAART